MNDPKRYPAKVFWSDEDEGFVALAPDLPGCSAWGESEGEALRQLREAVASWIEAAVSAGNPVPPPSRSLEPKTSGRILLRLPKSLHETIVEGAALENVSVNQHLVYLLSVAATCRHVEQTLVSAAPRFTTAFCGWDRAEASAPIVLVGGYFHPLSNATKFVSSTGRPELSGLYAYPQQLLSQHG